MTANSARKSPRRLTSCAYHTRRITVRPSTSRNDIGAGGAAASVAMGERDHTKRIECAAMRHALAALLVSAAVLSAQSAPYDLLLKNGRIVDGTGSPWFTGDVAIRGD